MVKYPKLGDQAHFGLTVAKMGAIILSASYFVSFCYRLNSRGVKKMKDLSNLTDSEKSVVLAKRKYMAAWRAKNPDKVQKITEKFYLSQAAKTPANNTESQN